MPLITWPKKFYDWSKEISRQNIVSTQANTTSGAQRRLVSDCAMQQRFGGEKCLTSAVLLRVFGSI